MENKQPQQEKQEPKNKAKIVVKDPKLAKLDQKFEDTKEHKAFLGVWKAVMGIFVGKGEALLKRKKADKGLLDTVVAEIMAKDEEEFKEQLKTEVKAFAKDIIEFEKVKEQKYREYLTAVAEVEKNFVAKGNKILELVKDRNELIASYSSAVGLAADALEENVENESEDSNNTEK